MGPGNLPSGNAHAFRIGGTRPPQVPQAGDQAAVWRIAARFRELREDDFASGFVIRRFERFGLAEVRT